MFAHGDAGGIRIARDNGVADRLMLSQRSAPGFRVLEIMRQLRKIGIEALVEQFADDANQNGVIEASPGCWVLAIASSDASIRAISSGFATRAACSAIAPSMNSRARSSSNGPSIIPGRGEASAAGSLT